MRKVLYLLFLILPSILYCQVRFDFETLPLSGWTESPSGRWSISDSQPISGNHSLKHSFNSSSASTDRISTPVPDWNIDEGEVVWRLKVKHGYPPSSSNSWWIFLLSDLDASAMGDQSAANGYILGVNYTGNDDLLKIWSVNQGISKLLITSSLNWQTMVGTMGIGAIEVIRKANGLFSLNVSVSGNFEDLEPYGTFQDQEFIRFDHFGICYRYTSTADQLLWIDDVSIDFIPLNQNDNTSEVATPSIQVAEGIINSTDFSIEKSVSVMRFALKDNASGDNLPTRVVQVTICRDSSVVQADWIKTIAGVKLTGPEGNIPIWSQNISCNKITLMVDSTKMVIPDGQRKEYDLSVFLNQSGIEDQTLLKFIIDSVNHGFKSGVSGSGFNPTFPKKVLSNHFTIQVDASRIDFVESPVVIGVNKPFFLSVSGVDAGGNTDKDFSGIVKLSVEKGNGVLSSGLGFSIPATNGIARWSDLIYSAADPLTIKAECPGFIPIETNLITVVNDSSVVAIIPSTQPAGGRLSSLCNSPGTAVEVMRFRLTDYGYGDGGPAFIKSIKLKRTELADIASFSKTVQGALIKVNGLLTGVLNPEIKTSYINIPLGRNAITVPDGGSVDVAVYIYLKTSGLSDNQKIQFKIDAEDHEFLTFPEGSGFTSAFPEDIVSDIFSVDVEAKKLMFRSIPERIGIRELFNITIAAVDENENTDIDFAGNVNLTLSSGEGTLLNPNGNPFLMSKGEITISSLSYDRPGYFALMVSGLMLDGAMSPLITCGDADGSMLQGNPPAKKIFTGTTTKPTCAVEIMNFKILDAGKSDSLPLIPEKFFLHCFTPSTTLRLKDIIGGILIKVNGIETAIKTLTVYTDGYEILLQDNALIIPDGDTVSVSLYAFLKEGGIKDKEKFQFYIPSSDHGWEASGTGTAFSEVFGSSIYGNECETEISASRLKFISSDFSIANPAPVTLKIASTDRYGNIDTDFQDEVELDIVRGNIAGSFGQGKPLVDGVVSWNDIMLMQPGIYQFAATGYALNRSYSDYIYCGISQTCEVDEDFENVSNPSFNITGNWFDSPISPIYGTKSLQHITQVSDGESSLTIPINFPNPGDKIIEWNLTLRNGEWDPSSDNYFYFVLMADSSDIASENSCKYSVGINPVSGNDFLGLWKEDAGILTNLITSDFDWDEWDEVAIKVGLTTRGTWLLWYKTSASPAYHFVDSSRSFINSGMGWSGLVFGYTASRSGQFWMDDLKICTTDYPPVINLVKPVNLTHIRVAFTEPVNHDQALNTSNYRILDLSGNVVDIHSVDHNPNSPEVILTTGILPFGQLTLIVDGVGDISGQYIRDEKIFGFGEEGTIGRLVISEIMANPVPSNGLPEFEYIELFNPTDDTITVENWQLMYGQKKVILPSDTIFPEEHAVLCSNSAVPSLTQYGKVTGVSGFPSLLNSGMLLKLFDSQSSLISFVDYHESWYGDDSKKNGGWSLERIDCSNLAEGKNNWKASCSPSGGTPCAVNSVSGYNPDRDAPFLLYPEVPNGNTIKLHFSEPMDTLMLTHSLNYQVDNGIGYPSGIFLSGDIYSEVVLTFNTEFNPTIVYRLKLSDDLEDFSGNHLPVTWVPFSLPQNPQPGDIVVNEILFNPYTGGVDFVEVYNRSGKSFDLSRVQLANRNGATGLVAQVYPAADTVRLLFPGDYSVITTNPSLVSMYYRAENPDCFSQVSGMAAFNNDAGYVVLLNQDAEVIDEMHYTEKMHFSLIEDVKGVSLERINPGLPSGSTSSWHSAAQSAGFATPTYRNSQYSEPGRVDDEFALSPETFSPDGDGSDDILMISYRMSEQGYLANIRIFDASGREVKRLASNELLGTEGTLVWDGLTNTNQKAIIGIYIIYIECFNLKGEVKKYKKPCVVAVKN